MSVPDRLFKYQPVSDHSMANVRNSELFFSRPSKFNDPFDCSIRVDCDELSEEDVYAVYDRKKIQLSPSDRLAWAHKYFSNGKLRPQFAEEVRQGMDEAFRMKVNQMRNGRGVACLSARADGITMWSHYANCHKGFCLEFDPSQPPFCDAFQVRYAIDVPAFPAVSFLLDDGNNVGDAFMRMITTKAECWSHEEEWRIFHFEPDKLYSYAQEALTGVYLGAGITDLNAKEVIAVIPHENVQVFRMHRPERQFRLIVGEIIDIHASKNSA